MLLGECEAGQFADFDSGSISLYKIILQQMSFESVFFALLRL